MPHAPMPWVKLYTSRLDDVRFNRLPDALKWRWAQLTMLAGKLDAGGAFVLDGEPMTDDEIAWQLRIEAETWKQESERLKDHGYLLRNGHGWQLTDYLDAQGPDGAHAEKRAQWRERQERHRSKEKIVTHDKPVSNASKSLESESESESRVEKSQSVITRELLTLSAVPVKHIDRLMDKSSSLTVDDFLAELARNYSRIGGGRGQVQHPPMITALNLEKGERPPANWYSDHNLHEYLPDNVLRYARPDLVQDVVEREEIVVNSGYTNAWIPEKRAVPQAVETAWSEFLAGLDDGAEQERGRPGTFATWIKPTTVIHYDNGKLVLAAHNSFALEWLISHNFQEQALEGLKPSIPDLSEIVITCNGLT